MNTTDLMIFILGLFSGVLSIAALAVAVRIVLHSRRVVPAADPPPMTDPMRQFSQRRKVVIDPNIVCLLPAYKQKRPEQRLW